MGWLQYVALKGIKPCWFLVVGNGGCWQIGGCYFFFLVKVIGLVLGILALFSKAGGGIFTKTPYIADLVGLLNLEFLKMIRVLRLSQIMLVIMSVMPEWAQFI